MKPITQMHLKFIKFGEAVDFFFFFLKNTQTHTHLSLLLLTRFLTALLHTELSDIKRRFFPFIYQVNLPKTNIKKKPEAADF